jgi:long-subunit acyl-CoA synthetase (AMP-forming)
LRCSKRLTDPAALINLMNRTALPEAATLPQLWDAVYRSSVPEHLAVEALVGAERLTLTYKEVNARAHCLAAYFLSKGMTRGSRVLLLLGCHPQFLPLDLAVQMAGGVSVVISPAVRTARLLQHLEQVRPAVIVVGSLAVYRRVQTALDSASTAANLIEVVVVTEDRDELVEADRATVLARAIELGKVFWREQSTQVQNAKASVQADSASAWLLADDLHAPHVELSHGGTIAVLRSLAAGLDGTVLVRQLTAVPPTHAFGRLGAYLPVSLGLPLLMASGQRQLVAAVQRLRASAALALPDQLAYLVRSLTPKVGLAGRWFTRALSLSQRVGELQRSGASLPLGLALQHRLAQQWLYQPLRRKRLTPLRTLFTLGVGLQPVVTHFYSQLAVPVVTHLEPNGPPIERVLEQATIAPVQAFS